MARGPRCLLEPTTQRNTAWASVAPAIPTKDERLVTLPLERIAPYVRTFLDYAQAHPELEFMVTRIGCGLAGYSDDQIAPMFADAPNNCQLPMGWRPIERNAFRP
jgi:hypothetical protein